MPLFAARTAAELVERISKLGIDYDKTHAEDMERLAKSNALLANYDPADFTHAVKGAIWAPQNIRSATGIFAPHDLWKLHLEKSLDVGPRQRIRLGEWFFFQQTLAPSCPQKDMTAFWQT